MIAEAPSGGTSTIAVVGGGDLALLGCGLVVDGFRRVTSTDDKSSTNVVNEKYKKTDVIPPSDIYQKAHTPKKQSNGSKKRTNEKHMHGQRHGGGTKPNFKPQNNKRKGADNRRNKGKIID
ncbi:MAG: hypothetical protein J5676_05415 [Bacteroidaceae bacterium]|nr:hypothetical protein [Bacteroidaceae bacterium]